MMQYMSTQKMIFFLFFIDVSLSLRNNNISDEGIAKLVEKGIQCQTFKKIA